MIFSYCFTNGAAYDSLKNSESRKEQVQRSNDGTKSVSISLYLLFIAVTVSFHNIKFFFRKLLLFIPIIVYNKIYIAQISIRYSQKRLVIAVSA